MPSTRYTKRGPAAAVARSTATEDEWKDEVWKLATQFGWKLWHFHDSRRQVGGRLVGDAAARGFPDLVLTHPRWGLAFVELKTDQPSSKPTPKQVEALNLLAAGTAAAVLGETTTAGGRVIVHLWRPHDLATVVLPALRGKPVPRFYGWGDHL